MCGNELLWHRESLTNQPRSLLPRILQHVNISALLLGCMSVYGCLHKKTTVNYLTTEGTSRGNANAVCISLIQVLWITCLSTAYWKKMWKMLLIGLFYIRDLLLAAPSRGHHSRWSASISHQPSSELPSLIGSSVVNILFSPRGNYDFMNCSSHQAKLIKNLI